MITFEEALESMLKEARPLGSETVPLERAPGRVLSENVESDVDMPPFDKSAMDGYACRREDLDSPLRIIERIPAGREPGRRVGKGECSQIMTGAVVPEGADCVVMVEHTEEENGQVRVVRKSEKDNICYKAEDVAGGDTVLEKGTVIGPAEVAVLAAVGFAEIQVSVKPVLAVAATGSELVEPSEKPGGAKIRNSNSYQLLAQARRAGFEAGYLGIAYDSPEAIAAVIEESRKGADVLLLSGGVSMGEYDFVPGVLKEKGYRLIFEKVAIKPGKPTVFGVGGEGFVFGMPGNPVSTFVVFELFVKTFCYALMGGRYRPLKVTAPLASDVSRGRSSRLSHVPVRFDERGSVEKVEYHGSAHIHAYTVADGFIAIPVGVEKIKAGTRVQVTII